MAIFGDLSVGQLFESKLGWFKIGLFDDLDVVSLFEYSYLMYLHLISDSQSTLANDVQDSHPALWASIVGL